MYLSSSTLTFYTWKSVCIFSILLFIHFQGCWQGEFVYQSRVVLLVIISFILMTLMCGSGLILWGEIRCQSLLGFKRLSDQSIKEEENRNRLLRLSQRWPPLHNGGEGLTVVKITVIVGKQIWDFEDWLLYTGWLLNLLLLNTGWLHLWYSFFGNDKH